MLGEGDSEVGTVPSPSAGKGKADAAMALAPASEGRNDTDAARRCPHCGSRAKPMESGQCPSCYAMRVGSGALAGPPRPKVTEEGFELIGTLGDLGEVVRVYTGEVCLRSPDGTLGPLPSNMKILPVGPEIDPGAHGEELPGVRKLGLKPK